MMRDDDFNVLLRGKKLSHQYFVDMYAKIEAQRLNYFRYNQKTIRVEDYCHLIKEESKHDCLDAACQ